MVDPVAYWQCRHHSLVYACRVVAERFGQEAVDGLAERHLVRVRERFSELGRAGTSQDLEAFASLSEIDPKVHECRMIHRFIYTLPNPGGRG